MAMCGPPFRVGTHMALTGLQSDRTSARLIYWKIVPPSPANSTNQRKSEIGPSYVGRMTDTATPTRSPMLSFRVPTKHHRDLIYQAAEKDRLSVSAFLRRAIAKELEMK